MSTTLADLLERLDHVEDADGYLAVCPAHDDSKPSLRLAVSEAGKVLLRCRAGCETPKVIEALGLTPRDLATMSPGNVNLERRATSTDTPADAAAVAALAVRLDAYHEPILRAEGRAAREYAAERFGVGPGDLSRLGLGFADDLGGGPRLVVPFRDKDGVARGFQARALESDAAVRWLGPKSPEGASWARIGWFPGSGGFDEVLITEGPSDALTGSALGWDTIGVRGAGLAANDSVVADIVAMLDGREAVIAGDGDPAGHRFASTLAEALVGREVAVRVLTVPDGLDLTDWRAEHGPRFDVTVVKAIASAAPVRSRTAALLAWDEDRYSLSDLGGARYLRDYVESLGSGIKYTEEVGFLLLEDGVWRKDEQQGVRTYAQAVADLVRDLARVASSEAKRDGASEAEGKRASRLNRYAAHVQTTRGLDSMIRELQAVQGVPARLDQFDARPDLVACRNGVVHLRTGALLPHDPSYLLTRRLDLDYNPAASRVRWEAFLEEIFPNHPTLPAYVKRLVGYGITGLTVEQCFAVLWGSGANGKSVLTDTLTEVFRELTVTTPFSTFEERPSGGIPNDLAALKGARLVMASEGEAGKRMAEAMLKRVTGRDLISARFMRKEFFEFRPSFLLMLATNNKPDFRGQDEGLWRRVKFLPFERFFAPHERDHRLGDRLLAEAEGILAWAVEGAMEWYANGLGDPNIVTSATKEYRETSDALAGFLGTSTDPGVFLRDPDGGRVTGKVLFDAYLEWASEENLKPSEVWTRRTFFGALEERGLVKRRIAEGVAFDGIRRARRNDRTSDVDDRVETPRAEVGVLASSSTKQASTITGGADLGDVL